MNVRENMRENCNESVLYTSNDNNTYECLYPLSMHYLLCVTIVCRSDMIGSPNVMLDD